MNKAVVGMIDDYFTSDFKDYLQEPLMGGGFDNLLDFICHLRGKGYSQDQVVDMTIVGLSEHDLDYMEVLSD